MTKQFLVLSSLSFWNKIKFEKKKKVEKLSKKLWVMEIGILK